MNELEIMTRLLRLSSLGRHDRYGLREEAGRLLLQLKAMTPRGEWEARLLMLSKIMQGISHGCQGGIFFGFGISTLRLLMARGRKRQRQEEAAREPVVHPGPPPTTRKSRKRKR